MRFNLIRVVLTLFLSTALVASYHHGGNEPMCWRTLVGSSDPVQLEECPAGMNLLLIKPPPQDMITLQPYNIVYKVPHIHLHFFYLYISGACSPKKPRDLTRPQKHKNR